MIFFWIFSTVLLNPTRKIPITLSKTDMNRIAVKDGKIAQIFGADLFYVEPEEKYGQIFLHVKDGLILPEKTSFSIVTEDGVTQDLLVQFKTGVAHPIVFERPERQQISLRTEAKSFFFNILSKNTDEYVRHDCAQNDAHILSSKFPKYKIQFKHRYLSKKFIADVYEFIPKHPFKTQRMHHKCFITDSSVCGVYISDTQGLSKTCLTIFKKRKR